MSIMAESWFAMFSFYRCHWFSHQVCIEVLLFGNMYVLMLYIFNHYNHSGMCVQTFDDEFSIFLMTIMLYIFFHCKHSSMCIPTFDDECSVFLMTNRHSII